MRSNGFWFLFDIVFGLYINKVSSFGNKIYPNYFEVYSLIRTFVPQLVLWHQNH